MPEGDYKSGSRTVFQYVVAVDYQDTLVSIQVKDATSLQNILTAVRADHALAFDQSATRYAESDFLWYEIDVTEQHKASKDRTVHLELIEYHKRRRQPFPESVALKDKQTMEYLDSRVLLSPYPVLT